MRRNSHLLFSNESGTLPGCCCKKCGSDTISGNRFVNDSLGILKGVEDGARTRDNWSHNPVLYQLSYIHHAQQATILSFHGPVVNRAIHENRRTGYDLPKRPRTRLGPERRLYSGFVGMTAWEGCTTIS